MDKKKTKKHRHKWEVSDWVNCPKCGWCGEVYSCECGEEKTENEFRKIKKPTN